MGQYNSKIAEVANAYKELYGGTDEFIENLKAQMYLESSNGTSQLASENMNYGGLTQVEPNGEENKQPDGTNYYRKFNSPVEYAVALHDDYFAHYPEIMETTNPYQYASVLKQNGYYGDNLDTYANNLASIRGTTAGTLEGMSGGTPTAMGAIAQMEENFAPLLLEDDGVEHGAVRNSFWGDFKDSFLNEFNNNGSVALLRSAFADKRGVEEGWKPNKGDLDALQKYFEGDIETQHFVLNNARNQDHMMQLILQKQQDIARQKRVDNAGYGLKSVGGLLGMALDPLNLVPILGQEAVVAKLATRLGSKTIANIGLHKATQMAELGITNGLINMGDQYLAEKYGGYKADYTSAFLFGAGMGAGARYLNDIRGEHDLIVGEGKTPNMDKTEQMFNAGGTRAIMEGADLAVPPVPTPKRDLSDIMEKVGAKNEEELARYLKANKGTKIYDEAHKAFNVEGKLTGAEFHAKLDDIVKGVHEEIPHATVLKDNGVLINGIPNSPNSVVSKAFTNPEIFEGTPKDAPIPTTNYEKTTEYTPVSHLADEELIPLDIIKEKPNVKPIEVEQIQKKDDEFKLGESGVSSPEEVLAETQSRYAKNYSIAKATQKLETGGILGNNFGRMVNSPSKTMRRIANKLFMDPRERGLNIGTPTEIAKKIHLQEYNIPLGKIESRFKEFFFEDPTKHFRDFQQAQFEYGATVSKAFHEKYRDGKDISHYSKAVQNAVADLKAFRDMDLDKLYKAGIIDTKDFAGASELWRRADVSKVNLAREKFISEEMFEKALTKYYTKALEYNMLPEGTDIDRTIYGLVQRDLKAGEAVMLDEDLSTRGTKNLGYYKERIPVNTSLRIPMSEFEGVVDKAKNDLFSFDVDLRDTDIINHAHYVANRSSANIALKQSAGINDIGKFFRNANERIIKEHEKAVELGYMTSKQTEEELMDFHKFTHSLTGARMFVDAIPNKDPNVGQRVQQLVMDASYAMNSMNFGASALAEHVGAIAQVGARALTHFVPYLHDFIHDLKYSKYVTAEQLKDFQRQKIGTYMTDIIMFDPRVRDRDLLASTASGLHMEALGATNDGIGLAGKLTSILSQVQGITNHSIKSITADIVPDMMAWSNGEFKSIFRKNLFSERSFKNAGIDDIEEFRKEFQKYIGSLDKGDPTALTNAMNAWESANPVAYMKFRAFLDIKAQEAILQPTLGSANIRGTKGILPILMQFKNFSRMAINSHLMRGMENWQREQTIQTLATALSGGMLWAIRMRATAETQYGDNTKAKQKFLDKTLTTENMLLAGITRSSILSGSSFGLDAYNIIAGRGVNTRTTVDRTEWNDGAGFIQNADERLDQFPVYSSMKRMFNGATTGLEILSQLEEDQLVHKDQARTLQKLYPLDRYLPIQLVMAGFADMADMEKSYKSQKKQAHETVNSINDITENEGRTIENLLKTSPKKKQELIDGINKNSKDLLKGRDAKDLDDSELVKLYKTRRKQNVKDE